MRAHQTQPGMSRAGRIKGIIECRKWFLVKFHLRIVLITGVFLSILIVLKYGDFFSPFPKLQTLLFSISISNVTAYGELTCYCPRAYKYFNEHGSRFGASNSTCDTWATARGTGQNVLAYTFFSSVFDEYFEGAEIVIKHVAKMYPGWAMRIYHNITLDDHSERDVLCYLWCLHPHLDLCDVRHLPPPLYNKSDICPTFWRFFVLGDPLIDRFLIRDMDSIIIQREVDAVNFWINSGRTWHLMRDHPNHDSPIMAGMWGGTNANPNLTNHLRNELIANGENPCNKTWDQQLLADIVWPKIQSDMVAHDGFHCMKYNGSQAWPMQRPDKQFVGDKFPWRGSSFILSTCPKQCRPVNHQQWTFC